MKQILYKIIYNSQINFILRKINKFLYPILPPWIKLPPSGVINLKSDKICLKIKTNQTSYLTQLLYWNGYKSFEYTPIFIQLINKINTFYDIGANIGYYSLLASKLNPKLTVRSFEPAEGPLHFLRENIALNQLKNVYVHPIAISNKIGKIEFHEVKNRKFKYLKHNLSGEGNAGNNFSKNNYSTKSVETDTLDHFMQDIGDNFVDLIKMDTEGTEHFILSGAHNILEKIKPIVICETLFNTIEHELEEILEPYGYQYYNHVKNGLIKVKSIIRKEDDGVRNCFFVHPSKYKIIQPFVITEN